MVFNFDTFRYAPVPYDRKMLEEMKKDLRSKNLASLVIPGGDKRDRTAGLLNAFGTIPFVKLGKLDTSMVLSLINE